VRTVTRSTLPSGRSRFRSFLLTSAAAVLACGVLAGVGASTPATASVASGPSYTFVDLGKSFSPLYENQSGVVVGTLFPGAITGSRGRFQRFDSSGSGVWTNGKLSQLPGDGYAWGLDDDEQIAGVTGNDVVVWSGAKHARKSFTLAGAARLSVLDEDEVTGNLALFAEDSDNRDYGVITDIAGHPLRTLAIGDALYGVSKKTYVARVSGKPVLGVIATGHETTLDFTPQSMSSDGAAVGPATSDGSSKLLLPDGSESTVPIDSVTHVNARHDIISGSQILPAGATTPVDAADYLPAGWSLSSLGGLGDDGSVLGYAFAPGTVGHGFMLERSGVSGTVYGVECGETTCSEHGLKGQLMLLTGKKSDGTKYSATAKTDAAGNYTIEAPPGSYQVGAAGTSGKDFVGPAFDPEWWPVVMKAKPITGKDFHVCAPGKGAGASAASSTGEDGASGADSPSFCQSVYTVTMQATLPGETVVDPSTTARYNTNVNPTHADYRDSTGYMNKVVHTKVFQNGIAGVRRQFPACMSEDLIKKLDKKDVNVSWYSSYIGGDSLGSLKVVLAYNQQQGVRTVRTVGTPTVTSSSVDRVWQWRYKEGGAEHTGSCALPNDAEPVVVPVSGDEPGTSELLKSQFAIMVAWGLPFAAPGTNLAEEGGVAAVLHEFGHLGSELYKKYSHLDEWQKFVIDSLIGYAIGTGYVKAVGKATSLIARFAPKLKYLPRIGGVTAERLHQILLARDVVNFVAGFAGEYPVMGTVLRGNFVTKPCPNDANFSCNTIMSLNAETTKFPDIQLKIVRQAETATYTSVPVFSGKALPWRNNLGGSTNPEDFNPYAHNTPYLISDASHSGQHLSSGEGAIETIKKDTENLDDLRPLLNSVEEGATPVTDYSGILAKAKDPDCDASLDVSHDKGSTLCYLFKDGRA
jgi:hypothetical protein